MKGKQYPRIAEKMERKCIVVYNSAHVREDFYPADLPIRLVSHRSGDLTRKMLDVRNSVGHSINTLQSLVSYAEDGFEVDIEEELSHCASLKPKGEPFIQDGKINYLLFEPKENTTYREKSFYAYRFHQQKPMLH